MCFLILRLKSLANRDHTKIGDISKISQSCYLSQQPLLCVSNICLKLKIEMKTGRRFGPWPCTFELFSHRKLVPRIIGFSGRGLNGTSHLVIYLLHLTEVVPSPNYWPYCSVILCLHVNDLRMTFTFKSLTLLLEWFLLSYHWRGWHSTLGMTIISVLLALSGRWHWHVSFSLAQSCKKFSHVKCEKGSVHNWFAMGVRGAKYFCHCIRLILRKHLVNSWRIRWKLKSYYLRVLSLYFNN